jgi:hypothetical protein
MIFLRAGAWGVSVMTDRASLPPSLASDMPPPSVELTLISVLLKAHMATLSPKKQRAFLSSVMDTFEDLENAASVVRMRSPKYDAEVKKARREALAWLRGAIALSWQLDMLRGPRE